MTTLKTKKKKLTKKRCIWCHNWFLPKVHNHKYCTEECQLKQYARGGVVTLPDGRLVCKYDVCSCGEGKLSNPAKIQRFKLRMTVEVQTCDRCGNKVTSKSCYG